jgi:hypothetical protein
MVLEGVNGNGRRERIRTSDPFVPNEVRYQAALHADNFEGKHNGNWLPLFVVNRFA